MRVALLTYSTRPRGGVVHTLALAEALARQGVAVTVYAIGRDGDATFFRAVDPAVRVRLAPLPDVPGETVGARVLRSIDALGATVDPAAHDVLHAQDCISANAAPGAIRTVHHLDRFTTPELARCHERAIVTPVAHVCVSHAVAAELRAGWGIEATVIPNGVEAERFERAASADADAVRARARWRAEVGPDPIVLAVGGIEPRKGTLDLVEAVRLLRSRPGGRGRNVRLVIAGGETLFDYRDYRAAFDAACVAGGVEPLVLGPVDHDLLPALVAEADVFAFPSTKEGFGLAAMEALAAGVPVVVRDLPVLREVFGGAVAYGSDPASLADALADSLALPRSDGGELNDGTPDDRKPDDRKPDDRKPDDCKPDDCKPDDCKPDDRKPDRRARTRRETGRALARRHRWDDVAAAHLALYERATAGMSSQPASVRLPRQ